MSLRSLLPEGWRNDVHEAFSKSSNRVDSFLVENLAIASLHFVTHCFAEVNYAMTELLKKWDAPLVEQLPDPKTQHFGIKYSTIRNFLK